ncbi:hypothetical protein GCM10011608_52230 [Micromonospora sonchi]|uniref:Uncharacterized protein n=2 Tax=Micromonospora sonchi TaxID=1763543 RepID=A0A917X3F4_9ACTN|nr:hypothetical protein GCM10011608_52230 [Micromonospora sonchi]
MATANLGQIAQVQTPTAVRKTAQPRDNTMVGEYASGTTGAAASRSDRYGGHMNPPLSRTNAEAHLYMDLHPCSCGESRFPRQSAVVALDDGDLASRYTGTCAGCGRERAFVFRLPPVIDAAGTGFRYGGDEPSQLLDPGEWLLVADAYAGQVPASATSGEAAQRARTALTRAVAALDEVGKFIPAGGSAVPPDIFGSDRGRQLHQREPGRFRRDRLTAVRDAYAGMLSQLG